MKALTQIEVWNMYTQEEESASIHDETCFRGCCHYIVFTFANVQYAIKVDDLADALKTLRLSIENDIQNKETTQSVDDVVYMGKGLLSFINGES